MNEKLKYNKIVIKIMLILILMMFIVNLTNLYAANPTIVNKMYTALNRIQDYFVRLAAPAASVAIAVGVMMRKFSFGEEEKMRMGKKVIFNAIICYAVIISIDLIIKFVDGII